MPISRTAFCTPVCHVAAQGFAPHMCFNQLPALLRRARVDILGRQLHRDVLVDARIEVRAKRAPVCIRTMSSLFRVFLSPRALLEPSPAAAINN